ncbi:MAG: hypothetical protein DIU84_07345 [Bacillota bacterium]|nr:MAG: hypothetical protein DIU84_07345 [Bacillota bacterium]
MGVTIWSSLVPPLPLLGLSLALDGRDAVIRAAVQADLTSAFAVAFLAYGATLFGFGMWNRLLARYPTGRIAPMSLLVPVTGILTAALVLDERLTWLQGLGCALVVAGLALTTLAPAAPARAAAGSARPR